MEASLHPHSTCSVLRVSGDLRLWSHKQAEERLQNLLPPDMSFPGNRLVLGLGGLTQIDSLGIGLLVKILLGCVKYNVALGTVLPPGLAGQSIRSTRIFAAWPEFASEEAAVSQSGQQAAS